jgi:hypothetical protein
MHELALNFSLPSQIADAGRSNLKASSDHLCREIDALSAAEWDYVVAGFDDLNLFQTAAFTDELRGARRMSHLLLQRNGVAVAGARVAIMKPPGLPIGIAYVKHGPFWRRPGTAPDPSVYRAVVAALVEEYGVRRGHMISISPRPHPHIQILEEQMLGELGFVAHARLKRPISFFLVNTGIGETALRESLSQKWRYNLKRAERHQLDIRFRDPMEGLADFQALQAAMAARKRIDQDPLHVLPSIFRQLPSSSSHIVTASYKDEVVAAAVVILSGDIGYYLYGASADAALSLNAGYALHWEIALWLSKRGIAWYDLGDAFGKLREFKQGFVGKSGAILDRAGEFDRWTSPQARIVGEAIYGSRRLGFALRQSRRWARKKKEQIHSKLTAPARTTKTS